MFKEPTAHPRWRLLQWINATVSMHDAICDCDHALDHLFRLVYCPLNENLEQKLIEKGFDPTKKCLTSLDPVGDATGETTADAAVPEEEIMPGELEDLFAETGDDEGAPTG